MRRQARCSPSPVTSSSSSSSSSSSASSQSSLSSSAESTSSDPPAPPANARTAAPRLSSQHWHDSTSHPFQCSACNRVFASQGPLTKHVGVCTAVKSRTKRVLDRTRAGGVQRMKQAVLSSISSRKRRRSSPDPPDAPPLRRDNPATALSSNIDNDVDFMDVDTQDEAMSAPSRPPPPSMNAMDIDPAPSPPPSPRQKRGWKPLRRLLATMDVLPQGPGQLHTAYDNMADPPSPPPPEPAAGPSRRVTAHIP